MKINLSPQRRDDTLAVRKEGDILTINGEVFDFTTLPDGATIQGNDVPTQWIVGTIERHDGELELTLLLPHGPDAPREVTFPEPIVMGSDGWVALPGQEIPAEPEPEPEPEWPPVDEPEIPEDEEEEEPVDVDP